MEQYHSLCQHILQNGVQKTDRTGTGTRSVFGYQMRFDLSEGFPLVTTKDMGGIRFHGIVHELLWFLSGNTNLKYLVDHGVNIWNRDGYTHFMRRYPNSPMGYEEYVELMKTSRSFARDGGYLGKIYGAQWRSWGTGKRSIADGNDYPSEVTIDQLSQVVYDITENPDSRRLLVSAWNVNELDNMALPPCHVMFQFYVSEGKLSCQLYQRSGDVFLGVPYNIASYALLTMMIAQVTGLKPGDFIHTLGDAHIYNDHIDLVEKQLKRTPYSLPKVLLNPDVVNLYDFTDEDIILTNYRHYPSIVGAQSF